MGKNVAIVGIGHTVPRPLSPDVSYREMIHEAAVKAYEDAGVSPRDVQSFTVCAEDFNEGISICDEYTPDQLGAVQKPVHTVSGDGIQGIADAFMQIRTGLLDLAVVSAHSKASNLLTKDRVLDYAVDPVLNRPLGLNPHYIAGLEMRRWLEETGSCPGACAQVVVKNRANALSNPNAAYAARLSIGDVLGSDLVFDPLHQYEMAALADGACVVVLASEDKARELAGKPVWVRGVGWNSDTPWLENREWGRSIATELAAAMAYQVAGIRSPASEIDFAEVDDTYAFKELQHIEALRLCCPAGADRCLGSGVFDPAGAHPVNVSGGSLGVGLMWEATGLFRVLEAVTQIRGEAGRRQLARARTGLVHAWRGVPTATCAVAVLAAAPGRNGR